MHNLIRSKYTTQCATVQASPADPEDRPQGIDFTAFSWYIIQTRPYGMTPRGTNGMFANVTETAHTLLRA